jgi:hypothetical protein
MIKSFLSFCLSLFKSHTQLHLEILFLRKQLEIDHPAGGDFIDRNRIGGGIV